MPSAESPLLAFLRANGTNTMKHMHSQSGLKGSAAFPGNAGPFVTPGTSPYQHSGSAASLAGFGSDSKNLPPGCPYKDALLCDQWQVTRQVEESRKRTQKTVDDLLDAERRASQERLRDPLWVANMALGWGGSIAGVYHGYKRNNDSVGWALVWGLLGGIWPVSIPLMLAQGFGKPIQRPATANRRRKRHGKRR